MLRGRWDGFNGNRGGCRVRQLAIVLPFVHIPDMLVSPKVWRQAARYVVGAIMAALFVYGAARFWDGPISEYEGGYRSTHRIAHTAAEYRDYKIWEKTILIVWPLGLLVGFLLRDTKRKGEVSWPSIRSPLFPLSNAQSTTGNPANEPLLKNGASVSGL